MTGQAPFLAALRDPDLPHPAGLADGQGQAAGRRFDVYRNNVTHSLIEALRTAFPTLQKLLGDANFTTLARAYQAAHPPGSPLMMFYGAHMPVFLAGFPPTSTTGYLPDIARLELALRESYHAADAPGIDPDRLQALAPDALVASRLRLQPALRLIRSDWPIHSIWRFNHEPGAPKPVMAAEDVLILRPEFDPAPHLLPPGGGRVVEHLLAGLPLGAAIEGVETDLPALLSLLIGQNAITEILT